MVIGANGFLGRKLVSFFSKNNEVIPVSRTPNDGVITLDATDKKQVFNLIKKYNPQVVIDTVAIASTVPCERNPRLCMQTNYLTAKNIAQACKNSKVKLVFISSSYVFDGKKGNYKESDKTRPKNQYSKTKVMAEKEVLKLEDSIVIRVDMMYGVENKKIKFGTGTFEKDIIEVGYPNQVRSPIFVDDVPKVIGSLIQKNQRGIFHAASHEKIKMIDFLRKLSKIEDVAEKIKIVDSSKWIVKSPANSTLDISKIISLGIKTSSFEKSLEKIRKQLVQ